MVRRAAIWGCAALCGLLPACQEILPLADDAVGDGGVVGGGAVDGTIGGGDVDGGTDPGLRGPLPDPKPGCAPVNVSARLAEPTGFAFTRRDPIPIAFEAPDAVRVEFRADVAGRILDRSPTGLTFSVADAAEPIRAGRYSFTVLAFDARGCASSAQVELEIDGDLLVGTRRGAVWFLGSDGRVLAPVQHDIEDPSPISALAVRHEPLRVVLGFDHADSALPPTKTALIEIEPGTGAQTEFALEDVLGAALYPSGKAPYNMVWSPDGRRLWADGMNENLLRVFHADGRHDASVAISDAGGLTRSVLGVFVGETLFAATHAQDLLFSIDAQGAARARAEIDGFDPEIRHIARGRPKGDEETVLVLYWAGGGEQVARFTVLGQALESWNVGAGLGTQVLRSGADLLVRSTTGGIQVHRADGTRESLLTTRDFTTAIGEGIINLGAMIPFE